MKDEIKEILSFKENADYKKLSVGEILYLEKYINSLIGSNNKLNENFLKIVDAYEELVEKYDDLRISFKTCKLMCGYYKNKYNELLKR